MNILILNWRDIKNPKKGGAEIVTLMHARAWVKAGHKVVWFASRFDGGPKGEHINGVRIVRWGNALTVYLLAPFFYLFSKQKFDLVIDEIHGLPFFTPLYVKKPKIIFIHEVAREIWDYVYPFPVGALGRFIELLYFKLYKNARFWTDASSTIDDLETFGIKRSNCIAIPCPIRNKTLKVLPKKEEYETFIFVNRLVRMKGVEEVIKAFSIIQKQEKKAKLWIVGQGNKKYLIKLHKITKDLGIENKVKFFGYVNEKKKLDLMRKAHILLHTSVKEGWGLVVIEAASQATPTVAYNVSGLRDSVKNGETGVILRENIPQALAKEAYLLLMDKKRYIQFQKNCLERARSLKWANATRDSLRLIELCSENKEVEKI